METWSKKETIFQGRVFSVLSGEAALDDGTLVPRDMIDHLGGVVIAPLLGDAVVMVRQYRIAVGRHVLELPAGRLEGTEPAGHRARLELEEETGYRARRMVPAASYYASAGYTNERMHLYLAFDLQQVGQKLEFDERVELVVMPLTEVRSKLAAAEFDDAKTIIGLRELLAYLDGQRAGVEYETASD